MPKWTLIIDVAKCEDCNNCFLACKDEHCGNDFPPYAVSQPKHGHRWMDTIIKERGQFPFIDTANLPVSCMHCDDAPCIKSARDGAVYRTTDGIVIIDPVKARGQKELFKACPYGAIWWNEEADLPQKCTWCAHLLAEGWQEPRCVQACPTGALRFLKVEDVPLGEMVKEEGLEVLHPEYVTRPRVYYMNLFRYDKCFIGGSVAFTRDGITDCAEGAAVALFRGSEKMAETVTDNYGDFKFDKLDENSGKYTLEITFQNYGRKTLEVDLTNSRSVGTVIFTEA